MAWGKASLFGILLASLGMILFFFSPAAFAQGTAQGFVISPAILEVEAEPGKSYDLDYTIENNTGIDNIVVDIRIETFQEGSIPGSANVVPFEPEQSRAYWLNVPKTQEYKLGEKKKWAYQLTVPDNTAPGAYFFAIVYQPQQDTTTQEIGGGSVVLKTRIVTLVFVNVGGDSSKQPTIENYTLENGYWVDPFFDRVDLSYDVQVKGNSFYRPAGNLFLTDNGSDTIDTLSSIVSERIILPGGTRSYNYCIRQSFSYSQQCGENGIQTSLPLVGQRSVVLRLDFTDGTGNPQTVIAEKQVFFVPYKLSLLVVVFLLVWTVLYRLIKRLRMRYAVQQST